MTKSFPQIKRLPVEDTLASLKAVTFGRADAALGEKAVVNALITKNLLNGLAISGEVKIGNPDLANLRIGVRDDWPLLRSALMKAMAGVTPQEMNQIRQKWIVADEAPAGQQTPGLISYGRLIAYGLAAFLALSFLSWFLIKALKREHIAEVSVRAGSGARLGRFEFFRHDCLPAGLVYAGKNKRQFWPASVQTSPKLS